jgi:hypothetical protein
MVFLQRGDGREFLLRPAAADGRRGVPVAGLDDAPRPPASSAGGRGARARGEPSGRLPRTGGAVFQLGPASWTTSRFSTGSSAAGSSGTISPTLPLCCFGLRAGGAGRGAGAAGAGELSATVKT